MVEADPRTFDLFADEEAVEYPTDTVKIYRNRAALFQLGKVEAKINSTIDPKVVATLEAEKTVLTGKIEKSALTVEMKGLPSTVTSAIFASVPEVDAEGKSEREVAVAEEARDDTMNMRVLEAMLVSISNAEGAVANHPAERTGEWFKALPIEGRNAVMEAMRGLSFSVLTYEAETESVDF